MKPITLAAASVLLFSTAAQSTTLDLTTFTPSIGPSGSVSTSSNFANLTANSGLSSNVSNVTSFMWDFAAEDYVPYNDKAYFSLNGVSTTLSNVAAVGAYGDSGWNTYTFASPFSGKLGFGIDNLLDNELSSQLSVTNVVTNVTSAVPEPETYTMMLVGLGLVGFQLRRKSKQSTPPMLGMA
jgi:hypothetical protein